MHSWPRGECTQKVVLLHTAARDGTIYFFARFLVLDVAAAAGAFLLLLAGCLLFEAGVLPVGLAPAAAFLPVPTFPVWLLGLLPTARPSVLKSTLLAAGLSVGSFFFLCHAGVRRALGSCNQRGGATQTCVRMRMCV